MTPLIRGSSRINGQQLRSRVLNPHVLRTPKLIYGYSPAHPGSSDSDRRWWRHDGDTVYRDYCINIASEGIHQWTPLTKGQWCGDSIIFSIVYHKPSVGQTVKLSAMWPI